jgi:hypothetical protein
VIDDWLFLLWFAVGMFAAGCLLAFILAMPPNFWAPKDKRIAAPPTPEKNAADAVEMAFNVVDQTHNKLYLAFEAMSPEDRVGSKGPPVAHMCALLWKAYEQIENALQVARGDKIVSMADPETRAHTYHLIEVIELVEDSDESILPSPKLFDPGPTVH